MRQHPAYPIHIAAVVAGGEGGSIYLPGGLFYDLKKQLSRFFLQCIWGCRFQSVRQHGIE